MKNKTLYRAIILNPQSDIHCDFYADGGLLINSAGKIEKIDHYQKFKTQNYKLIEFKNKIILPGFIDIHFHWVQDDVREKPKVNLLKWLKNYTWPEENKYKNKQFAEKKAIQFFKKLASKGTIAGVIYSSIHENALNSAFKYAKKGHFNIGNVVMTMNSPKYLTQNLQKAIKLTEKLAKKYKNRYVFTPRFAITCDPEIMKKGSIIGKKHKSWIQTHLSETKNEIKSVLEIFKKINGFEKVKTYTEIYNKCGVLTSRTILGHCIYLSDSEYKLLAKKGAKIAHCPTSNAPIKEKGLGSGLMDFKKVEKNKVEWGLATDIGGGPYLSMLDVMKSFVAQNQKKGIKQATEIKALYRSTLANAKILKIEKTTGNLDPKKEANFVVIPNKLKKIPTNAAEAFRAVINSNRKELNNLVEKNFFKGKEIFSK